MALPKIFSGKNGDRNLLIAAALVGGVAFYWYKQKNPSPVVSGLLPAYRG